MLFDYWLVLVFCGILLFLKSFAYGNFLRLEIADKHNNKYFKKHKSKNFLKNYFYIGYFKETNKLNFIINFILPIMAAVLFVSESIIFAVGAASLYMLGNIIMAVAVFTALLTFVYAMIYSWVTSESSILTIILAIIVIIVPIALLFYEAFK